MPMVAGSRAELEAHRANRQREMEDACALTEDLIGREVVELMALVEQLRLGPQSWGVQGDLQYALSQLRIANAHLRNDDLE